MKELSIEQKAQRYDEAIERARQLLIDGCSNYDKETIWNIFPELKESEDERMIRYFKDLAPFDKAEELYEKYGFSHEDAIAWLEKQCEHANFINKIQIGDKVTRNEDGILVNLSQLNRVAKKDEKQGEQKHQYNSRPRYIGEEELLGTNKQGKCPFLKQELIDMGFAFTQDGDLAYPIHKIEKKEFAAWSEEDERIFQIIVDILDKEEHKGHLSHTDLIACVRKLKSFRPQPNWKPSGEQVEAFEHFVRSISESGYASPYDNTTKLLYSLLSDLKKLKG